jgi:hypothetical protein
MEKRILVSMVVWIGLCIGLTSTSFADPYSDGLDAYNKKDYATAISKWKPLAEQGNADGQNALGRMYAYGYGVTQDYAEAVKWFRKAAEQGNADGQVSLGGMYERGWGVTQDYAEAEKWLRKAAEQGVTSVKCCKF